MNYKRKQILPKSAPKQILFYSGSSHSLTSNLLPVPTLIESNQKSLAEEWKGKWVWEHMGKWFAQFLIHSWSDSENKVFKENKKNLSLFSNIQGYIFLAGSYSYHHDHSNSTTRIFSKVWLVYKFTWLTMVNLMALGPSKVSIHIAMSLDTLKPTRRHLC